MTIRHGLGVLAVAGGLIAAAPPAQGQALTVPPDLRAPGAAPSPEPAERGKPRTAKPKKAKPTAAGERSLTVPGSSGPKSPTASQGAQREYPPDIDRNAGADEPRIRPSVTPSGGLGIGGRF